MNLQIKGFFQFLFFVVFLELNTSFTIYWLLIFNKQNGGDIQFRLKPNKHQPFTPIFFFNDFFSSHKCTNAFFYSLKYYTVKKSVYIHFNFIVCNSGERNSNHVHLCSTKCLFSVTICSNTFSS